MQDIDILYRGNYQGSYILTCWYLWTLCFPSLFSAAAKRAIDIPYVLAVKYVDIFFLAPPSNCLTTLHLEVL